MIDINNQQLVANLRKTANTPQGKAIIEYFTDEIAKHFNYDNIDLKQSDEQIGKSFKIVTEVNKLRTALETQKKMAKQMKNGNTNPNSLLDQQARAPKKNRGKGRSYRGRRW